MTTDKQTQFADAFCEVLNRLRPGWETKGGWIRGPEGVAIRFAERHCANSQGHVDVEFSFQDSAPRTWRLWDCVTGLGSTLSQCAQSAAHLWGATTAGPMLEF